MPRKAKEFKGTILRIEGLSDPGKPAPQPQRVEYDDFTGEPIPITTPEPKPEPIAPDHRQIKHKQDKLTRDIGMSMLIKLGLGQGRPDPILAKPKLTHRQRLIKLGDKEYIQTVDKPLPPWRRT